MISIVIPTYNEEEHLPKLLDSIGEQTCKDYEIIVADNDSRDRTIAIAADYGCRIVHGGLPSTARNRGAAAASGEYIFFMDADIVLDREFLSQTLRQLNMARLDVAGVYMATKSKNVVDRLYYRFLNFWFMIMQYVYPHCVGSCMISTPKVQERIKGFDPMVRLAEDNDYVRRASKHFKFGMLREKVYVSARRFEKEGRLKLGLKYALVFFHRILIGEIKTDLFRYRFGHYQ